MQSVQFMASMPSDHIMATVMQTLPGQDSRMHIENDDEELIKFGEDSSEHSQSSEHAPLEKVESSNESPPPLISQPSGNTEEEEKQKNEEEKHEG